MIFVPSNKTCNYEIDTKEVQEASEVKDSWEENNANDS
jgi:hypothetical protein